MFTSRRFIKLLTLEFLQWCGFASPVFFTAAELGRVLSLYNNTSYWLVVSISIGYVAASTLIIWLPIKILFQWYKKVDIHNDDWCQSTFLYFLLSAVPCSIMIMESTKFTTNSNFQEISVELIVIMLAIVGITEKMKEYKLLGSRLQHEEEQNEEAADGSKKAGMIKKVAYHIYGSHNPNVAPLMTTKKKIRNFFSWFDLRAVSLLEQMLSIYDIRLILSLASIAYTREWICAIYSITLFGMMPLILTRYSRYYRSFGVLFLDLPFFFLRLVFICVFKDASSILFMLKNLFVLLSHVHFNIITELLTSPDDNMRVTNEDTTESNHYNHNNQFEIPIAHYHDEPYTENMVDDEDEDFERSFKDEQQEIWSSKSKKRKKLESTLYQQPYEEVVNTSESVYIPRVSYSRTDEER